MPSDRRIETPPTNDEFTNSLLGPQWQWQANHHDEWYSLTARPGWLRLFPQLEAKSGLEKTPSLLLQKFPARSFVVETRVELNGIGIGDEAGVTIVGRESAGLAIVRGAAGHDVVFRLHGRRISLQNVATGAIRLRVEVADGGRCTFAFATGDGDFKPAPETFQAQPGVWIGAKVGIYASRIAASAGYADFDYVRFGRASC